ncbi:MAG: DUF1593 domain-containing protein, partial [Nitrospinae bacterium]|nr:DUF1593 domain-containing protein [Nitrospinota bacterium]
MHQRSRILASFFFLFAFLVFLFSSIPPTFPISAENTTSVLGFEEKKLRVIIETDIGGDLDDQASFVRWLMYSNEWDIEGIITTRPPGSRQGHGYSIAKDYINAYGDIVGNLKLHKSDYPSKDFLLSKLKDGQPNSNDGRDLIIAAVDKNDPRPLWFSNWGADDGTTSSLKRALDVVKSTRSEEDYNAFIAKIMVTAERGQNHFEPYRYDFPQYIDTFYPDMDGGRWYHRWEPLTQNAGGFNINTDVKTDHGPLGAKYTIQKEGDTPVFMFLIPNGLVGHGNPTWGSWSGRLGQRDHPNHWWMNVRDTWEGTTNRDNTLKRWAVHLQNDFKARMDWAVNSFENANHEPQPVFTGQGGTVVVNLETLPGSKIILSASGSTDPDGDELSYNWKYYPEPGTYEGSLEIENSNSQQASFVVPSVSSLTTMHIILSVTDNGVPPLTRYRRIIVTADRNADSTPPSVPQNLAAVPVSESKIDLSWSEVSDSVSGIANYQIYRNGILIGQSPTNDFLDSNLNETTTYSYTVSAVNFAGLESVKSNTVPATTLQDLTPPKIISVHSQGDPTKVNIGFSEPIEENTASEQKNYEINNGIIVNSASLSSDEKTVTLITSAQLPDITYTLTVSNIKDRAKTPNVISPSTKTYSFILKLIISNLDVKSSAVYEIVDGGLQQDALIYVDRNYVFTAVPEELQGATYIKTANNDKSSTGDSFLSFDVNQGVSVFVAHDGRISQIPPWLSSFADTWYLITSGDATFSIYKKDYASGTITLGGNYGSGNSMYSVAVVEQGGTVADTTPPTAPTIQQALADSASQITVSWTAATDEVGVTIYTLYRNGTAVGTTPTLNYVDKGLAAGTTYAYTVTALDAAGNESTPSAAASVTTLVSTDTLAPTVTLIAPANGATVTGPVTVTAAAADNIGVLGVQFQLNGTNLGPEDTTNDYQVTWDTSTLAPGTYTLTALARDAAGNATTAAPITVTVTDSPPALELSNVSVTSGRAYQVIPNGLQPGASVYIDRGYTYTTVPTTLVNVTYLQTANNDKTSSGPSFLSFDANQSVTVYVGHDTRISPKPAWLAAFTPTGETLVTTDVPLALFSRSFPAGTITLGGNDVTTSDLRWGQQSMYTVAVVGQGGAVADSTPPSAPIIQQAQADSASQITVSWTAATDEVGVTAYTLYRNGTAIGTTPTLNYVDKGLAAGTTYAYTVTALDAAGNESAPSEAASVTTLVSTDTLAPTVTLIAPANGATVTGPVTVTA